MPKILTRVRNKAKAEKLKVVFVVGSLSKWKCQSLYDLMVKSDRFDPMIVLIICDVDLTLPESLRLSEIEKRRQYFAARDMRCEAAYLPKLGNVGIARYRPDMVFYSQPWGVEDVVSTYETAKTALVFYVQYYITLCESKESVEFASYGPFYRHLCAYFAQTPCLAESYRKYQGRFTATKNFVGLGHPMLDQFTPYGDCVGANSNNYVIYAPHWTIVYPGSDNYEDCATFLETGEAILEYAKLHSEFKWVFKPHPSLRATLIKSGLWSESRVDAYYEQWGRIGVFCDGQYVSYFNDSRALITDSLSFLYEYVCTGRPIVRLLSEGAEVDPPESACGRLFGTYYAVRSQEEMIKCFSMVLERSEDPNRDSRLAIANELGLFKSCAGKKIYEYLLELVDSRSEGNL